MPRILPWLRGKQSTTNSARVSTTPRPKRPRIVEQSSDIDVSPLEEDAAKASARDRGEIKYHSQEEENVLTKIERQASTSPPPEAPEET